MLVKNQNISPNFILNQEWLYRGEGNANLVLSLVNSRKIIRIHKNDRPSSFIEWLFKYIPWNKKIDLNGERDLRFYTEIILPFVGSEFVSQAIPILITNKEISELNSSLKSLRPETRQNKSIQSGRAVLLTDHAFLPKDWDSDLIGPTLAIEIKPKQGWVPFSDRQGVKCPYCLNQYVKAKNGSITAISEYCPLDLFSGNKDRMILALKRLVKNPQNNFRAFKDGRCIYNNILSLENLEKVVQEMFENKHEDSSMDIFIELLWKLLSKPYCKLSKDCDIVVNNDVNHEKVFFNNDQKYCDYSRNELPPFCVLERILSLQKVDCVGCKGNYNLYKYLNSKRHLDNWEYIDKVLKLVNAEKQKHPKHLFLKLQRKLMETIEEGGEEGFETLDETYLVPYVVASIANDCSLMVTIRKIKAENERAENVPNDLKFDFGKNGKFAVNFGIFDLYPKPLSVIQKHKFRNQERYSSYLSACNT